MNASDKKALKEFQEDMAVIAKKEAEEVQEDIRREWAQRNGNDSGFDPYWNLD